MFAISNISEFGPRGGRYFSKMSELSEGEGGFKPNWEFVPKGPRENVISDLNMLFVMAGIIVLILND